MSDDDGDEYPVPAKVAKIAEEKFKDVIVLTHNILMYPDRKIGEHRNICEGEVRSSVYGVRPCAIKFAAISEQNIREAEILTKLGSHTNVITIIQSGTYCDVFEEHVYIALDKCHNENLRQYLANRKAAGIEFDLIQAIDFAKQIIAGVVHIHENNVIHLDLKPSNILITQDLRLIKIADFGLSIIVKSPKSKLFYKRQFGTNGYRPIESFGNAEVSQRTDIFSLGTVLFHLLSNGQELFGNDEHSFLYNIMNEVVDTSGLLVGNPIATEHLIRCMVYKERCRRPTIWEVADHPCWSGLEEECNFECLADDEFDDTSNEEIAPREGVKELLTDYERTREFLKKMRGMGFNRQPTIIVFDHFSKHLHRVDEKHHTMAVMSKYPTALTTWGFSAATYGEYIYVFCKDRSAFRLEYCDATAKWEKLENWIGNHGNRPPVVTASNSIFLIGGSYDSYSNYSRNSTKASNSVSKFDAALNQWEMLQNKPTSSIGSALLSTDEYLYCFGGLDNAYKPTGIAERMNLSTMKWSRVANMRRRAEIASAAASRGHIYVVGSSLDGVNTTVEAYSPQFDLWALVAQREDLYLAYALKTFVIGTDLFIVGDNRILKFDLDRREMNVVMSYCDEILSVEAVLARMSK